MVNALGEFFKEYIGPKYHLIQKATYKYLDFLKGKSLENIYTSDYFTPWSCKEYKDDNTHHIISLIKGKITDFKFGFDDDDEEDDYYDFDFDFDDDFNIDDIFSESDKNTDKEILEINEPEKKSSKAKKTVSKKSPKKKANTKKVKK